MMAAQDLRRPLIGAALSVALGFYLQHSLGGSPLLFLGLGALSLALAVFPPVFRRTAWPVFISCGLLAAAYGALNESRPSFSTVSDAEPGGGVRRFIGTVEGDPVSKDDSASFLFRVTAVCGEKETIPADAVLRVYLKNKPEPIQTGEQWLLAGIYNEYEKPRGGADGVLSVAGTEANRIKETEPAFINRCYEGRRRAANLLTAGIEKFPEKARLLHAMLLGYREAIAPEFYRQFTRTGTLHIFAISGQHVVILGAIFIALLKICGVSRPRWGYWLIPAMFLYILTTGVQPSALRALTMAAVYFVAPLAGRRPDAPSAAALATVLLLIADPSGLTDPGFLLSFTVVYGLIMTHEWMLETSGRLRLKNNLTGLDRLSKSRFVSVVFRSTGLLILSTATAWFFSAPIVAVFFNTISPVALIGNLPVIPLTFMVMLTSCLTLCAGAVFWPAAVLFNQANLLFLNLLLWIVEKLSALPAASLAVRPPSALSIGLWYSGLIFFFSGPVRWRKAALLTTALAAVLWAVGQGSSYEGIKVLRERNGSAAVCLPGKRWVLATDGNPFSTTRTMQLLQKQGVNRLHTLAVSTTAAADAVRRLQEAFRPEQTIVYTGDSEPVWPAGEGFLWIAGGR